jgi:hypothetical protein
MLPVRSFKQGQITSDEVRDLLARMRDAGEHKTGEILEGMAAIGSYAGDILVADAGLHVAGHLDLFRERAWVLMVCGDLVVDGVLGALHAGLVISGPTGPRLDVPVEPEVISTADPRLLDYLDRELLYAHDVTYEDGSPVLGIDLGELCQRVRNGTRLRTA